MRRLESSRQRARHPGRTDKHDGGARKDFALLRAVGGSRRGDGLREGGVGREGSQGVRSSMLLVSTGVCTGASPARHTAKMLP